MVGGRRTRFGRALTLACAALVTAAAGACNTGVQPEDLGTDLTLEADPTLVDLVRGDPAGSVVRLLTETSERVTSVDWEVGGLDLTTELSAAASSASGYDRILTLSIPATADIGTRGIEVTATALSADGVNEPRPVQTVTVGIQVRVVSALSIDVTGPADGATVNTGAITVEGQVRDALGLVTRISLEVNGADPVVFFDGTPAASVDVSETVTLQEGANAIVVAAENDAGERQERELAVTYTPAGAGSVVEWDNDSGDGLWLTAGNWVGDVLPGPGDEVLIDDPTEAPLLLNPGSAPIAIRTFTVTAGSITVGEGELQVMEAAAVQGGTVSVQAPGVGQAGRLTLEGELALDAGLACSGGAVISGGPITAGPTADLTVVSARTPCRWEGVEYTSAGRITVDGELELDAASRITTRSNEVLLRDGTISCSDSDCGTDAQLVNTGHITLDSFSTNGSGRSAIRVRMENEGTVAVASGVEGTLGAGLNTGTITGVATTLILRGAWTMTESSSVQVETLFLGETYILSPGEISTLAGEVVVDNLEANAADISVPATARILPLQALRLGDSASVVVETGDLISTRVVNLSGEATLELNLGTEVNVTEAFDWRSGTLAGQGQTRVEAGPASLTPARLRLYGDGVMALDGHRLILEGLGEWRRGDVLAGGSAVFRIGASPMSGGTAVLEVWQDGVFDGDAVSGGGVSTTSYFQNYGTLRKVGGTTGGTVIRACYNDAGVGVLTEQTGSFSFQALPCL